MLETKFVDLSSRPWARAKEYQNFIGNYRRHKCGLWFDTDVDAKSVALIAAAFRTLPAQLTKLAREYELTVSVSCLQFTSAGNSATIYADWDNSLDKHVSPHVQFGLRTLQSELLKPHFTHELSHLWFRRRCSLTQRAAFIEFVKANTRRGDREVTEYVHDTYFIDFLRYAEEADVTRTSKDRSHIIAAKLSRWVEESFCETVAAIRFPGYPFDGWKRTVDLEERRKAVELLTGLIPERAPAGGRTVAKLPAKRAAAAS